MGDFALNWDPALGAADLALEDDDLQSDDGLRSAVLLSLFLDQRADDSDALPANDDDRRGWWADGLLDDPGDRWGSKAWLLSRSKAIASLIPDVEAYAQAALKWMLTDRVAKKIDVVAEVQGERLAYEVTIHRPDGREVSFRFAHVWDAEAGRWQGYSLDGGGGGPPPGPTPLVDFDFATPLTSWKTGFTGFASAYATDEWLLQETSGTYANNKGTATLSNSGGLQGQTAVGLWDGSSYVARKAWEATAVSDVLTASDTTAGDADSVDLAFRTVLRFPASPGSSDYLFAKRDAGSGWSVIISVSGYIIFSIDDGPNIIQAVTTVAIPGDGSWCYVTGWYDESAKTAYIKTSFDSQRSATNASMGSFSNTGTNLKLNGRNGDANAGTPGMQAAYFGVCVGANAQAMYDEDFWQHAEDPTGLLTTATRACLISVPVAAGYVGHFSEDQLPIGYHSAFSDANKLGLYCNSAQTNYMEESEDFSTWTNTNTTDTAASGDAPDGFRTATKLTANADNGYIWKSTAALAATTQYTFSVWVKRAGGSDVNGKLRLRDAGAPSETDQAFTATATWQRVQVSHTMGATPSGRAYIYIDTNTEEILIWGAQTEKGSGAGAYIRTSGATASLVKSTYRASGNLVNNEVGDASIVYVPLITAEHYAWYGGFTGESIANYHEQFIASTDYPRLWWSKNTGASEEAYAHANQITYGAENTLRQVWSTAGVDSAAYESVFYLDGVRTNGGAMPLEGTIDSGYKGVSLGAANNGTYSSDSVIQSFVVYEENLAL